VRRLLGAAGLALLAAAFPVRADAPLFGRTIADLRFEGDAPVESPWLARLTDLGPGQTLTEAAVHAAVRNLFATRRFSDIAILAAPLGDRVLVRVHFASAPRIARVELQGTRIPERGRLREAMSLEPGETWSAERGEASVRGVARVLKELGYFEPKLELRVESGPDDVSVALVLTVEQGPRARVVPAVFAGNAEPVGTGALARRTKLRAGKPFRQTRAREDAERLTAYLQGMGYARAEVRYDGEVYDAAAQTAQVRYALFVGPMVVLTVDGASVSSVRNHPESPWSRGEPPDEESIRRLKDALVKSYQEKGYARVEVSATLLTEPGKDRIDVVVRKGTRFSVEKVSITGAHSFPGRELAALLRTRPRGLLATGRLVERDLSDDRGSLLAFLASRGFPDARTSRPEVRDGTRPFTLDVAFPVEQGAPVIVADRRIEGNASASAATLLPLLSVVPGEPFQRTRVSADEAALSGWYLSHGYPDVRVTAETRMPTPVPPQPLAATVIYRVFEGDPVVFGKTIVRGNAKTRTSVIEGQFAHGEGKPFALGRLIETQQALTRLGVFSRIDMTPFPTDPGTRSRSVVVTLTEAHPWNVLYGFGAEYDPHVDRRLNLRLSLGVSYADLFGRALVAGVEGRYSPRDKRLVGTLRDPTLFRAQVPVTLTAFYADEIPGNYEVERHGAFLEGEHRFGPSLRTTLRYQYEIVRPTADRDVLSTLERQNQAIAISSLSPGIILDTRSDPVDPHAGFLASADIKYAFPFLAADASFAKGIVQAALFRPFQGTVIALSARVGAIEPFNPCDAASNPTCPPNLQVPIAERFFAGGRATHRSFPLDDLGIPGETVTVNADGTITGYGGNGLLIGNIEWRIPVVGDLGVSLFLDSGNVWADYRRMKLSQLRTGAGIGLHYLTPIGPLRLEYGWKLDRKESESAGEASFSVGYPF
jgi:outer membrane protein insertion porin family